ncbi:MAG TPA: hypothetical protein P5191_16510 [Ruminococcus sp.]|nr:hypothetical protein [Ruminococcus sp.]
MYKRREFNKSEVALSNEIKSKLIEVEGLLDKLPNCREKSIALTHIEDAMLHSNLAITETGITEE